MAGLADKPLSLQDVQRELAELESERAALTQERRTYRRLGFSTERLNLRLCHLNARQAACEQALKRLQGKEQPSGLIIKARSGSSPLA